MTELGGLYVLATERHEARRIDNQLRGRSGRQGDPGATRFYLSLQDDLMRLFKADMVDAVPAPGERARRAADRVEDGHQRDPQRPDAGRGAALRDPQGRPEVRRRDEPPAPGDLRGAAPGARGRGHPRAGAALPDRHHHRVRRRRHGRRLPRAVGPRRAVARPACAVPGRADRRRRSRPRPAAPGRPSRGTSCARRSWRTPVRPTRPARRSSAPRRCASWSDG